MGTVFEFSGKIGHSGTILYWVPNVWEWPQLQIILKLLYCTAGKYVAIITVATRVADHLFSVTHLFLPEQQLPTVLLVPLDRS